LLKKRELWGEKALEGTSLMKEEQFGELGKKKKVPIIYPGTGRVPIWKLGGN